MYDWLMLSGELRGDLQYFVYKNLDLDNFLQFYKYMTNSSRWWTHMEDELLILWSSFITVTFSLCLGLKRRSSGVGYEGWEDGLTDPGLSWWRSRAWKPFYLVILAAPSSRRSWSRTVNNIDSELRSWSWNGTGFKILAPPLPVNEQNTPQITFFPNVDSCWFLFFQRVQL